MKEIILDGKRMTGRREAHGYIAEALGFPEYYGGNLDALADCLGEMGGETRIVLVNGADMLQNLGRYGERVMKIFAASGFILWPESGETEPEEGR